VHKTSWACAGEDPGRAAWASTTTNKSRQPTLSGKGAVTQEIVITFLFKCF